jgi:ABC-type uncharacterized transport system involved in gliding motility auxiliary subunit
MSVFRSRVAPLIVGNLGLLACATLVLLLAYRHNLRLDLTPQRAYTLSPHAQRILGDLDEDVTLTAFVRTDDPRTPYLKDLLWRLTRATPRIQYEIVDLNRSPARAKRYGIDRYGALVVEAGGRRRDVANVTEPLLMGTLLEVTRAHERVAYFVVGHGERSPDDTDRRTGYSTAQRALQDEQFRVRTLSLLDGPVPPDATVVVLAGPRRRLLPEELRRLDEYLDRGGSLLAMLEPETPEDVVALLQRRGVQAPAAVIVDPERRLASGEQVTVLVSELDPRFGVSAALEASPLFSYARPLQADDAEHRRVARFLATSAASHAAAVQPDGQPGARGAAGPLTVGVAVEQAPAADGKPGARVIALGDADFATNSLVDYLGNKDLLVNAANWLARDDTLIAARAQKREAGREQFFVSEAQSQRAFWLAAVLQPALFFLAGVGVVLWARRP